jgi:vancomycin resistance protein YoaR
MVATPAPTPARPARPHPEGLRPARSFRPRSVAGTAIAFAVGGLAGWLVVPVPPGAHDPALVVTLAGQPLPLGDDAARTRDAATRIARDYVRGSITVTAPGLHGNEARTWTREAIGASVEGERLDAVVREVRDPASALRRAHAKSPRGAPLALPVPVRLETDAALDAILAMKDDLDVAATSARIDLESRAIIPARAGARLDAWATLGRLDEAMARGEGKVAAAMEAEAPFHTAAQIADVAYGAVLGAFETKYDERAIDEARVAELGRQASRLDGVVILAGETFDYLGAVGEAGAPEFPRVRGAGAATGAKTSGGTPRISLLAGTVHAAAFFAGLEIAERHPLKRPSAYLPMGLDARVAYPATNLRIKNPYAHAVVLRAVASGARLRVEVLGPARSREVTFERKVNETFPYAEREIEDPKVPRGVRTLAQRGVPGFDITRYRVVRDGATVVRERTDERYPPSGQIWRRGVGEPDRTWKAHDDPRPEYLADESLTLTMSDGVDGGAPALVEARVPGASGVRGWTAHLLTTKAHKSGASSDDPGGAPSD